jgi:hypothetical protein
MNHREATTALFLFLEDILKFTRSKAPTSFMNNPQLQQLYKKQCAEFATIVSEALASSGRILYLSLLNAAIYHLPWNRIADAAILLKLMMQWNMEMTSKWTLEFSLEISDKILEGRQAKENFASFLLNSQSEQVLTQILKEIWDKARKFQDFRQYLESNGIQ